jgi:UDP-glucose 4-epimerase
MKGTHMIDFTEKRILITGINGFIGNNLCRYFISKLKCKHVFGIDKDLIYDQLLENDNLFCLDIENYDQIYKIISKIKPEIIFHLAANITPSRDIEDLDEVVSTNIYGTINVIKAVIKNNIKLLSLINFGTSEEYGDNIVPFKEYMVPNPISLYSGTKAATSLLCKMFFNAFNIPVINVRPSLVYGPGQNDRFFIIHAIKKLLNNENLDMTLGEQTRDYLYIDDLLEALVGIVGITQLLGGDVNISSGEEYVLREVVLQIKKITNSSSFINLGAIEYRQSEIMRYCCDNSKLTSTIGWVPSITLEKGLERTIEYYKHCEKNS